MTNPFPHTAHILGASLFQLGSASALCRSNVLFFFALTVTSISEGSIDPGNTPDPATNPLAFANNAPEGHKTNAIAVQFGAAIFYK